MHRHTWLSLASTAVILLLGSALPGVAQPGVAPDEPLAGKGKEAIRLTAEQRAAVSATIRDARAAIMLALTPDQQSSMRRMTRSRNADYDAHVGAILAQLTLTAEQDKILTTIRENAEAKVGALGAGKLTREQAKLAATIRADEQKAILDALTPEQKPRYTQLRDDEFYSLSKKQLDKSLNLTKAQQDALAAIETELTTKLNAIKANAQLTAAERKAQSGAAQKEAATKMAAVYTPEQQAQVKKAAAEKGGLTFPEALAMLTLTTEQQAKIGEINATKVAGMRKALSAEQQALLTKLPQARQDELLAQLEARLDKPVKPKAGKAK